MKSKFLQAWDYVRARVSVPAMILISLVGGYLIYAGVRDWRTNRAIERQSQRIDEYAREARQALEKAGEFQSRADINHAETILMLDVVKAMSGNIEKLAENDRVITVKVNDLRNEYENARSQKRTTVNRSKPNRPLAEREREVLENDKELYSDDEK